MLRARPIVVALAASTMLTSVALAAEQAGKTAAPDTAKTSPATQAADKDFSKLSADGLKAFRDVHMARLAIFDGQSDQAKKYADEARTAIGKAKSDDTVYMKAEAELKPPAGMAQKTSPAPEGKQNAAPSPTPSAWLPIDGGLTLGEDFVATPEKAANVAKANEQLKKGDHKQAMDTLKLSDINVSFVMEVAPLDNTVSGIDNAAQLIDSGKYYEGNQTLKGVEDAIRYDVVDTNATPPKTAGTANKAGTGNTASAVGNATSATPPTSTPSASTPSNNK